MPDQKTGKKKHTLTNFNIAELMGPAIAFDAVTFFLPAITGDFLAPLFWACAGAFFWIKGMGFVNGKRLVTGGISFVAELIPAVQALPTMSVAMAIIIAMSRFEDKTGVSIISLAKGKPGSRMNVDGARMPPPKVPAYQGDFRPPVRPPNGGLAT